MTYLLDTTTCIHFLNERDPHLTERVRQAGPSRLSVSTATAAELFFGAARSARPEANRRRVRILLEEVELLPFDGECAEKFGRIKADLLAVGRPIPDFDIVIAATALANGLILVARDRHFQEVEALEREDWISL